MATDDVNVTDPPVQNVVEPDGVITGAVGEAFTVTVVPDEVAVQLPLLTVTV